MSANPYEIDLLSASLRRLGSTKGKVVFLVETEDLTPLAACNFRRALSDFTLTEFEGDFHLGHDDIYVTNPGNNFVLAVQDNADVARLNLAFIVR